MANYTTRRGFVGSPSKRYGGLVYNHSNIAERADSYLIRSDDSGLLTFGTDLAYRDGTVWTKTNGARVIKTNAFLSPYYNGATKFTIAMWAIAPGNNQVATVFQTYLSTFGFSYVGRLGASHRTNLGGSGCSASTGDNIYETDTPIHICNTVDLDVGYVRIYANGSLVVESSTAASTFSAATNRNFDWGSSAHSTHVTDMVAVDSILSDSEIKYLAEYPGALFRPPPRLFILPSGIDESSDESISVTEASLTFTPSEVTITGANETVNVTEDTLTLTPSTAFVDETLNVTEGTLTFTVSTAFVDEVINTTEASLTFTASTAFVDEVINTTESSLTLTASTATINEGATVNVTEDTLTLTASAATLTETIPVTEDTLTFTASTATIADGSIIEVTEGALSFTASTAFVDEVINVTEQSLTLTASAATVRDTIQVSEGTLTLSASAVTIDETIPVTEDTLTFTASAASISDGTGVDPPNIDGQASVTISSNYGQVKIYCRGGGEYFTWTETVVVP